MRLTKRSHRRDHVPALTAHWSVRRPGPQQRTRALVRAAWVRRFILAVCLLTVPVAAAPVVTVRAQAETFIGYGAEVTGDVTSSRGERWRFSGCADDVITIVMTGTDFAPLVELYAAGGTSPLTMSGDRTPPSTAGEASAAEARIEEFVLPRSGQYTIAALGATRGDRGAYTLALTADDGASRAVDAWLPVGEPVAGDVVTARGELWGFRGCAGDAAQLVLESDALAALVEVYAADATVPLADAVSDDKGLLNLAVTLPAHGAYEVVVLGRTRADRGAYTMTLTLAASGTVTVGAVVTDTVITATLITDTVITATETSNVVGPGLVGAGVNDAAQTGDEALGPGACVVVSAAFNLRPGPGLTFSPPVALLEQGAMLLALARNEDASWLEVEALTTGAVGWVSSDARFVRCADDPLELPLGARLPAATSTPRPLATATLQPTPAVAGTPLVVATATPVPTVTPVLTADTSAVPAPVALTYGNKNFSWRWDGLDALPDGVDWYFDVKIFNNEFSQYPYDVKVAEFDQVEAKGDEWFYLKSTDFRCGSYWAVQIALRHADGSYAGALSPESNRIPTNRGCEEPLTPAPDIGAP